jgi:hypothetical protein
MFRPPPGKSLDQAIRTRKLRTKATTIKLLLVLGSYRYAEDLVVRPVPARGTDPGFHDRVSCLGDAIDHSGQAAPSSVASTWGDRQGANLRRKDAMIAAIMKTPAGPYVVRLVSAKEAVAARAPEFIRWLKSFR